MTLHEPATFATDCLLAAIAAGLAWRLRARTSPRNLAARGWVRALALTAVSAVLGGSYHGFAPEVAADVARVWWTLTLLTICLTGAALDFGLLREFSPARGGHVALGLIVVKFAVAAVAVVVHPKFFVALATYGLSLVAWGVAALVGHRPWAKAMLAAIGLSGLGALVQQMRWAPSPHFNHNDLYHVVQVLALAVFYRAARRLGQPGDR